MTFDPRDDQLLLPFLLGQFFSPSSYPTIHLPLSLAAESKYFPFLPENSAISSTQKAGHNIPMIMACCSVFYAAHIVFICSRANYFGEDWMSHFLRTLPAAGSAGDAAASAAGCFPRMSGPGQLMCTAVFRILLCDPLPVAVCHTPSPSNFPSVPKQDLPDAANFIQVIT